MQLEATLVKRGPAQWTAIYQVAVLDCGDVIDMYRLIKQYGPQAARGGRAELSLELCGKRIQAVLHFQFFAGGVKYRLEVPEVEAAKVETQVKQL